LTENEYNDKSPNKYVVGYSFGGLFANLLTMYKPNYFNGQILLAPAFYYDDTKYKTLIKFSRFMNKIFPTMELIKPKGIYNYIF
jgi:predicted alpha/beta superfamily hydrolase